MSLRVSAMAEPYMRALNLEGNLKLYTVDGILTRIIWVLASVLDPAAVS